jgi:hypothetical protein
VRITKNMVQKHIDILNTTLFGDADTSRKDTDGRWRSIPERYVLDAAYGGYKLSRYCNEGGGQYDITNYRMTARELYYVVSGINTVLNLDAHRPLLLDCAGDAKGVCYAQH